MANKPWDVTHLDIPDQLQHQKPDQFDAVREVAADGWEPFAVMPVYGPETSGGATTPMVRVWFKRPLEKKE